METQKPSMNMRGRIKCWLGFDIIDAKFTILHGMIEEQSKRIHDLEGELYEFRTALKAKVAQSAFDKKPDDKIAPSGNRYVPVARRRAAAEAASAGPATHKAEVLDNNARAMETL
jgi:hypothetical protein